MQDAAPAPAPQPLSGAQDAAVLQALLATNLELTRALARSEEVRQQQAPAAAAAAAAAPLPAPAPSTISAPPSRSPSPSQDLHRWEQRLEQWSQRLEQWDRRLQQQQQVLGGAAAAPGSRWQQLQLLQQQQREREEEELLQQQQDAQDEMWDMLGQLLLAAVLAYLAFIILRDMGVLSGGGGYLSLPAAALDSAGVCACALGSSSGACRF